MSRALPLCQSAPYNAFHVLNFVFIFLRENICFFFLNLKTISATVIKNVIWRRVFELFVCLYLRVLCLVSYVLFMFLCMIVLNVMPTNACYITIISLLAYGVVAHIRCSTVSMFFGCCIFFCVGQGSGWHYIVALLC
jgi:hypothetical protein